MMMPFPVIFLLVDLTYCAFPFEIDDPLLHRQLYYIDIGNGLVHRVRMNQHPRTRPRIRLLLDPLDYHISCHV